MVISKEAVIVTVIKKNSVLVISSDRQFHEVDTSTDESIVKCLMTKDNEFDNETLFKIYRHSNSYIGRRK